MSVYICGHVKGWPLFPVTKQGATHGLQGQKLKVLSHGLCHVIRASSLHPTADVGLIISSTVYNIDLTTVNVLMAVFGLRLTTMFHTADSIRTFSDGFMTNYHVELTCRMQSQVMSVPCPIPKPDSDMLYILRKRLRPTTTKPSLTIASICVIKPEHAECVSS
jgi:hypothetical protein